MPKPKPKAPPRPEPQWEIIGDERLGEIELSDSGIDALADLMLDVVEKEAAERRQLAKAKR